MAVGLVDAYGAQAAADLLQLGIHRVAGTQLTKMCAEASFHHQPKDPAPEFSTGDILEPVAYPMMC